MIQQFRSAKENLVKIHSLVNESSYLAWVSFATLLNYEFLQANPDGGQQLPNNSIQRIEL